MKENIKVKAIGKMISTLSKSEVAEIRSNLTKSKEIELFEYFVKGNDEEIPDFKKLKKELKSLRNKVVNQLAQFKDSYSESTELKDQIRKMNSEYAAFNVMQMKSDQSSIVYLGESIVEQSVRYKVNVFIVPVLVALNTYYSYIDLNHDKLTKYSKLLEKYSQVYELEVRAKSLKSKYLKSFVENLHPEEAIILGQEYLKELEPIALEIPSFSYKSSVFYIKIFLSFSMKDYKAMRNSATNAISLIHSYPFKNTEALNSFTKKIIEADLLMFNFAECEGNLHSLLSNSKIGSTDWHNTLEILLILQLNQKDYKKAQHSFSIGKNRITPLKTQRQIIHRWGIIEAYMNFLDLTNIAKTNKSMSRFKINKYINETPLYTKDKKGRNIQIIIAQLLFLIVDKNWDAIVDKVDSLQKYSKRYLKSDNLYRSSVFIKMLVELPKHQSNTLALERHSKKYLALLQQNALEIQVGGGNMEIIPYEDLWQLILTYIAKK